MSMRLKVSISPLGSGLTIEETLDLYCGNGEQILQWVGYAACARLGYKRGEVYGRYLPQSVCNKDGQPLDIDIVVNEILHDGDELFVEYSNGPTPYRVRWEGRPRTPPFKWGDAGEVVPPHDTWLTGLDMRGEGLGALIDPDLLSSDPALLDKDLAKVKQLLVQYAGGLQALFLLYSSEGASSGEQLGQITLPQFRGVMQLARVISPRFLPEKVDEIFTNVATSETTLARKVESKSGVSAFDLLDLMIAMVHVAYHRYAAENPTQANYNHLSVKVMALFRDCFSVYAFPELQRKLDKFVPATANAAATLLLRRGRKLTEQTLNSCQLKRSKSAVVRVDLRWLCNHLQRWGYLGKDFNLQELALIAIFAKHKPSDPEAFHLQPQPLEYDYNEFERLLLGIACHLHITKKRPEPFEEFLGETLDNIYKKAKVLLEVPKDKTEADD